MSTRPNIIISTVANIISRLRLRYKRLKLHYEAAWTESWHHRRCMHDHQDLIDAAKCATPHGCGWYVLAVETEGPRQLTDAEDQVVNRFRFDRSTWPAPSSPRSSPQFLNDLPLPLWHPNPTFRIDLYTEYEKADLLRNTKALHWFAEFCEGVTGCVPKPSPSVVNALIDAIEQWFKEPHA